MSLTTIVENLIRELCNWNEFGQFYRHINSEEAETFYVVLVAWLFVELLKIMEG
jgi:hypothetical protein